MFWRDFTFDLFKAFSKHTLVCQGHLKVIKINKRRFINEYFCFILDDFV